MKRPFPPFFGPFAGNRDTGAVIGVEKVYDMVYTYNEWKERFGRILHSLRRCMFKYTVDAALLQFFP